MAAVEVRERTPTTVEANGKGMSPAAPNGRAPDPHSIAEPEMTRAARAARAAWRLEHLDEWRRDLESLGHFDPEFIYDVAHEYGPDSTTDPDYGAEGVYLLEYDEDGVVSPLEKRAWKVQERMSYSADDALADTGREADYELEVRFRPETIARANRVTRERHPVQKGVRADLIVLANLSVGERERFLPEGILRLDLGAPVPELVLEVMSRGSAHRDLNYKKHLYEAAGVSEYLIYDLGSKRRAGSPRELLMYRLTGEAYHRVAPEPRTSSQGPDEYWSNVFGTRIRFLPAAREETEEFRRLPEERWPPPRFQWWDREQDRWRDRATDAEHKRAVEQERMGREREARGETRGETKMAIAVLHRLLSELPVQECDRIAAHWQEHGPPANAVDRILEVQQSPTEWRSLLLDDPDEDRGPNGSPNPREPHTPGGGW